MLTPSILEEEVNTETLTAFVSTLKGKDGTGSHLVTVPPGPRLADALISSFILAGEGWVSVSVAFPSWPSPLRVYMEEQRQQEEEALCS